LVLAGGRDRLANPEMVYQEGYVQTQSPDKQFIEVNDAGHLDILTGINSPQEVMAPIAKWLHERG